MKTFIQRAALISGLGAFALGLSACGPTAPQASTPSGQPVQGDKGISGDVTGNEVGASSMVAVFGAFSNVSGNKIDLDNKTIEADTTLAVAPVSAGKYNFALPKAPQKAQGAIFKVFAFNDSNGNKMYDQGESKSKEASITWSVVSGYTLAQDADGNNVATLGDFKDFDFKLGV
ncbi:MAG: hypothetical protein CVV27_04790 [Candidatus Melainabacteria bacterium HGW-Melainabacteria-1]|nr:MAG: hypothetical protein CVV27_04790 [Candidatus Melainabacteria bacterium HGW-Melainabacteria-1]